MSAEFTVMKLLFSSFKTNGFIWMLLLQGFLVRKLQGNISALTPSKLAPGAALQGRQKKKVLV